MTTKVLARPDVTTTRRQFVSTVAGAATVAALAGTAYAAETPAAGKTSDYEAIPPLAPQWQSLDLAKILRYPAAFVSISQVKSLYDPEGAQAGERQWERPTLAATVKAVKAARAAPNFKLFAWVGYEVFRENYPQSEFDAAQYASWIKGKENWSAEKKKKDNELPDELRALVRPGDLEFNELALQSSFIGTALPLELARREIKTVVLTGIHLDWCIEGNARAARDMGYLPIVIGDATSTQKWEDKPAAMMRINNFWAPVISSDTFVKLLNQSA
jgi:nicotinamidase-related amidase